MSKETEGQAQQGTYTVPGKTNGPDADAPKYVPYKVKDAKPAPAGTAAKIGLKDKNNSNPKLAGITDPCCDK